MLNKIIKSLLFIGFAVMLLPKTGHSQITLDSIKASFDIYERLSKRGENGSVITINQDAGTKSVLQAHFNKGGKSLRGWRVRILRDNSRTSRDRSAAIMGAFRSNYPGVPVYRDYAAPYWYVNIGDFRTRDEAEKMKEELKNVYPSASLIEVNINFPPL